MAEDLWRRLDAMDIINRGMLFAATLLLCFFPFLIVVSALAGRPVVKTMARYTGLNSQAAADVDHLLAPSASTASAVVGTTSMVFFVLGGIAAATALQELYEQAFDLPHRGMKDILRRLAWLVVLIGASLLSGWAGPGLRHVGGEAVFSLFFSAMVISDEKTYGPIGIIFALLSYLIALGVVVILGAVVGLVWQERLSGRHDVDHYRSPQETAAGPTTDSTSAA